MAIIISSLLIEAHPWAADQWADDPDLLKTINVSSPKKVRWRCADGHEFIESPHVRTGKQGWKNGAVDACPFCLRHRYLVTFRCGHTREYRATSAEETPGRHERAAQVDCDACRPQHEVWGTPEYKIEKSRLWCEEHPLQPAAPSTGEVVKQGIVFGEVRESKNPVTSAVEERVRDAIRAAGYKVPKFKMAVHCHHPNPNFNVLSITPDIVLVKHKIAIEVDPLGDTTHALTHTGEEEKDRERNDLLEAVGWCVIRLRLGAKRGDHIGDRDVVVGSSGITKDAQAALIAAIEDRIAGRKARVRFVKKGKTPTKAQRKSTVANLGENRYSDDGHYFKWFPDLNQRTPFKMKLFVGGRYLYVDSAKWHQDYGFIAEVGLHEHPYEEWRERLVEIMATKPPSPTGTTPWPWGETFLTSASPQHDSKAIIDDCERRAKIEDMSFYFTTNCDDLATCDPTRLMAADETPIAILPPAAADAGYRFVSVELLTGYSGTYQRIIITREASETT